MWGLQVQLLPGAFLKRVSDPFRYPFLLPRTEGERSAPISDLVFKRKSLSFWSAPYGKAIKKHYPKEGALFVPNGRWFYVYRMQRPGVRVFLGSRRSLKKATFC